MKTLVIIPAFNEQDNISQVIEELKSKSPSSDYIVVNDCSEDNTSKILEQLRANYINLPVNLGIGGGVQTGYMYALENDYDIAIQMDGDGQHNAEYIRDITKPIEEGKADVVIGSRFIGKEGFQSSMTRRIGINFLSNLINISCRVRVKDVTSGFRAVNKEMIKLFANDYAQDYPEPEAIVLSAMNNARIKEIPVIMNARENGKSSISNIKSVYYMIKVSIAVVLQRLMFRKVVKRIE